MILENNVRIPQIIAVVLQGLAVVIALGITLAQGSLVHAPSNSTGVFVIPPAFVFMILHLIIYVVYFIIIHQYSGNSRRVIGIAFIVINTLIQAVNPYITVVVNMIWNRKVVANVMINSQISSYVAFATSTFTIIAVTLFYISCARYGVSKAPGSISQEYQNYQNNVPYQQAYGSSIPGYQGYQNNNDQ